MIARADSRPSTDRRLQIALVVATAALLGLGYSLLLPLFIAPDEPAHVDGVRQMVAEGGFLTGGAAHMSEQTLMAERELQTVGPIRPDGPHRRFLVEDATPRPERPSFDDLGSTRDVRAPNYIANHPPTYYLATGVAARTVMSLLPEGAWSFDRELLLLRWLNVLLLMATTWVTYRLARAVGLGHRAGLVAMALPLGIPQFVHIGSTVNNDNLYTFASAAFMLTMVLLVRPSAREHLPPDAALWTGLAGSMVVLSKAQGLVALPVLAGLAVWMLRTRRPGRGPALVRLLLPPAVLVGPMLLLRVVRTGSISPQEGGPSVTDQSSVDVLAWGREYLNMASRTFWGAFGWLDAAIPWQLTHVLSILAGTAVVVSLVVAVRAGRSWLLLPWGFGLLAAGLPIAASLMTHLDSGAMRAMQGRYSFPLVPIAACTVLLATRSLARRTVVAVGLASVAAAAMSVAHYVGIRKILDRHWGPDGTDTMTSLQALAAWSPLPFLATVAILVLAALALVVVVAVPIASTVSAARSTSVQEPEESAPVELVEAGTA